MLIAAPAHLLLFVGHERDFPLQLSADKGYFSAGWSLGRVLTIPGTHCGITIAFARLHLGLRRNAVRFLGSISLLLSVGKFCPPARLVGHRERQEANAVICAEIASRLLDYSLEVCLMQKHFKELLSLFACGLVHRIFVVHRGDGRTRHNPAKERGNLLVACAKDIAREQFHRVAGRHDTLRTVGAR